jgi:hypothetical protein
MFKPWSIGSFCDKSCTGCGSYLDIRIRQNFTFLLILSIQLDNFRSLDHRLHVKIPSFRICILEVTSIIIIIITPLISASDLKAEAEHWTHILLIKTEQTSACNLKQCKEITNILFKPEARLLAARCHLSQHHSPTSTLSPS